MQHNFDTQNIQPIIVDHLVPPNIVQQLNEQYAYQTAELCSGKKATYSGKELFEYNTSGIYENEKTVIKANTFFSLDETMWLLVGNRHDGTKILLSFAKLMVDNIKKYIHIQLLCGPKYSRLLHNHIIIWAKQKKFGMITLYPENKHVEEIYKKWGYVNYDSDEDGFLMYQLRET